MAQAKPFSVWAMRWTGRISCCPHSGSGAAEWHSTLKTLCCLQLWFHAKISWHANICRARSAGRQAETGCCLPSCSPVCLCKDKAIIRTSRDREEGAEGQCWFTAPGTRKELWSVTSKLVIWSLQITLGAWCCTDYWYEQAGKGSCSRLPRTDLFCSREGAKFDSTLSPRQHQTIRSVDLPRKKLPGDLEQQILLILAHTASLQRWVCLYGCLTGALLFLARSLGGHLHSCWQHLTKVQTVKEPEKQGCGQHLRNRMPSRPQASTLETGSEAVSLWAYTEKKTPTTQHIILCLPYLFINFLWNIFAFSYAAITLPA